MKGAGGRVKGAGGRVKGAGFGGWRRSRGG